MRSLFKISVFTEGPLEDGCDADHCGDEVGQEDFVGVEHGGYPGPPQHGRVEGIEEERVIRGTCPGKMPWVVDLKIKINQSTYFTRPHVISLALSTKIPKEIMFSSPTWNMIFFATMHPISEQRVPTKIMRPVRTKCQW